MSINLNNVNHQIYKISECNDLEDFIAIGIELDEEGEGHHSGIIISLNNEITLFHFDGIVKVEKDIEINEWFCVKKLEIFEDEEDFIINFKAHCELICEEADPEFGFLFDGSYYESTGEYYTDSSIKDITTCVGFCIKIIKGYLYNHNDYIDLNEWDSTSLDGYKLKNLSFYNDQLERLEAEYPDKIEEIKNKYLKRILPSELTSSGFYRDLPIGKQHIDFTRPTVEMVLKNKRLV